MVTVAISIFHRYPNIEITVSSLLPRDIHWSTRIVKINETNDYLRDYCKKEKKLTFMRQPRLDFARQLSKHGTVLQRSPSVNWKWKHEILKINYWNIAGCIITTIIIIMIIILITIILYQIATSIFFTQVKPSSSSTTFPIIFISITVSDSNTLQPET